MFDDIIFEKPKTKQTTDYGCVNCSFGSWLASKENGKIWCEKRQMHMHPGFKCPDWRQKI